MVGLTDGPTDRRTDGRADGWTDTPSYRNAWSYLKIYREEIELHFFSVRSIISFKQEFTRSGIYTTCLFAIDRLMLWAPLGYNTSFQWEVVIFQRLIDWPLAHNSCRSDLLKKVLKMRFLIIISVSIKSAFLWSRINFFTLIVLHTCQHGDIARF